MKTLVLRVLVGLTVLAGLLMVFPLDTALQIGGDDSFELAKGLAFARTPELAKEMWNDQPWAYTMVLGTLFRICGEHAAIPRLISVISFAMIIYSICRLGGIPIRSLETVFATAFLVTFDQNVYLLFGAMVEPPCAALGALAAVIILFQNLKMWRWVLSGAIFALSLNFKLTGVLYGPAILLIMWLAPEEGNSRFRRISLWASGFILSMVLLILLSPQFNLSLLVGSHAAIDVYMRRNPGAGPSFNVGYFLVNPAILLSSLLGFLLWKKTKKDPLFIFCASTFCATLLFGAFQRPFWRFYLIHFSIPLCGLGACGAASYCRAAFYELRSDDRSDYAMGRFSSAFYASGLIALLVGFAGSSFVTQVLNIANLPQYDKDPVCLTMRKGNGENMRLYTQSSSYSFFGGVVIPPDWTVIPSKREWINPNFEEQLFLSVSKLKPEMLVLGKKRELLQTNWSNWVVSNYALAAQNDLVELWVSDHLKTDKIGKENRLEEFGL